MKITSLFCLILSGSTLVVILSFCINTRYTGNSVAGSNQVQHVVLISLDGSRPEFYMDTSWPAPNLQRLKEKGVYAAEGIESVFPSVTYPAHTTIITGAYPAAHGIYYNSPFGADPGHWYWNESDILCPTLWNAIKQKGMTSGSVMWPVTVGAPIDYNFPVRRPEKRESGDELTIKLPYITPPDLLSDIEDKTGKKFTAADLSTKNYAQSKTIALISNYIIKAYKPNLMAIHLVGIDHVEHANGTDGPEVRDMVRVTDSLVGTIVQAISDAGIKASTAIIITGDHGHTNTLATFAPNIYLVRHDIISDYNNWKAKFHSAGGSAFLYLKEKNDRQTLDKIIYTLKNSPEYKNGDFRILIRATLDRMGANPECPIALAMKNGITANNRIKGDIFEPATGPVHSTHGYDPAYPSMHTEFIAAGAGIAAHKNIQGMGIKDIAPVIAKLLNLNFQSHDGKLIPGIVADNSERQ